MILRRSIYRCCHRISIYKLHCYQKIIVLAKISIASVEKIDASFQHFKEVLLDATNIPFSFQLIDEVNNFLYLESRIINHDVS